jgi:hypothetical protein
MSRLAKAATVAAAAVAAREAQLRAQDRRAEKRGEATWSGMMKEIRADQKREKRGR